jgi:uncharacterized protein YukJ
MPLKSYGVLKGEIIGSLPDADDDHYQILVEAASKQWRIAVNVKSQAAPSALLYVGRAGLPARLTKQLQTLKPGFTKLKSVAEGLAQDFVRGGLVDIKNMVALPADRPGDYNDLRELVDNAVGLSLADPNSAVFAFGEKWGPEKKKDRYFHFKPGQGIHDVHMNQGNAKKWQQDDGVWQDGCLMFYLPVKKQWRAIFLAFQSQSFKTDDKTGHALP